MPDLQLTFDVGSADPAPIEEALTSLGATSVTLEDAADNPVLEPAPGETPLWLTIRIRALFQADADRGAIEAGLVELLPATTTLCFELLEDRLWEREWLRDFHPMRFGRRLWVCPDGQAAGDAQAVRVALDPGLAFGTGTHPTTALCLEWLDGSELAGCRVVDYGCGSGILAIAALKLGAAEALAFDIDPQARLAARDNAVRSGVADRLTVAATAPHEPASCDALVANILAGPLTELAGRFATLLRPGGRIALSGVLAEQAETVAAAYGPWFIIGATTVRDGWALLSGSRVSGSRGPIT
jgi:ribosomal protein L11 methyltransferase